jgi:hypothetical protein
MRRPFASRRSCLIATRFLGDFLSMKTIILAAVALATGASADAAVTFNFTGTEFGGAHVEGALTIDTALLAGANGAADPALFYYFATGDGGSTAPSPFLSVSFSSMGSNPSLLSAGDFTFQSLQADPADGSIALELDWQVENPDHSITSSAFTLSGFDLTGTTNASGVLLPDFESSGPIYFTAKSGTGPQETYDVISSGTILFGAIPGVPEPASWAMMVIGFGAVGHTLRRRTRVAFTA